MARLSETDLQAGTSIYKPQRDGSVIHVHLDDDMAAHFVDGFDGVFLCKAWIDSREMGLSQDYIFYIYFVSEHMNYRLQDVTNHMENFRAYSKIFWNYGDESYSDRASDEYISACRIMEKYIADKNRWENREFTIFEMDCAVVNREDSWKIMDNEYVKKLFENN